VSKAKRGRPPKKANERREVFALRLSVDERKAIEGAAVAAGLKVTEWARNALLSCSMNNADNREHGKIQ
jgi:hypothetical protein